ncbi:HEPN domain-containing protein [Clostridium cylindrosporum]|uniref:HEPN domain-cntaining protein n=1 Tax=Clostridium cylindrosporum DSM 605 TaxID=1121307 RepID=A0A0J8DFA0_CLOCY|nr:HEPN domain-containing protein [Clostridium cylindrosporum]KMT22853.1 HEPN domain-cntaining protein [Clostridium cylindrosporum DSM 605]
MSFKLSEFRGVDWIYLSKKHIDSAIILLDNGGDMGIICFHIQQAIEKNLKGYVLVETGELMDGHSLISLVNIAADRNPKFIKFKGDCPFLSSFYIEDKYPSEDPLWVKKSDVEFALNVYNDMNIIIKEELKDII